MFQPVNRCGSYHELWETRCRDLSTVKGSVLNIAAEFACSSLPAEISLMSSCSHNRWWNADWWTTGRNLMWLPSLYLHKVVFTHRELCSKLVWLVEAEISLCCIWKCVSPVYWIFLEGIISTFSFVPCFDVQFVFLQGVSNYKNWIEFLCLLLMMYHIKLCSHLLIKFTTQGSAIRIATCLGQVKCHFVLVNLDTDFCFFLELMIKIPKE